MQKGVQSTVLKKIITSSKNNISGFKEKEKSERKVDDVIT